MWEKGSEPIFTRKRIGNKLSTLALKGSCANYLFAPLHFMEHTAGFLCVRNCLDLMRIKGVSVIVSTLTMALRTYFSAQSLTYINRVLSGVSMKDGLTGLYNRLGYHELAYPLYRKMASRGEKLSILFLDMDRLKHINDDYGHGEGDGAILCVATAIRENVPSDAIPVRYGGDEFLIISENSKDAEFEACCGKAREGLSRLGENVSFSGGYVYGVPDDIHELRTMIMQADEMLYDAKGEGRDRFKGAEFNPRYTPKAEAVAHYKSHTDHTIR
jgi:diguanylate cyclase (GGDEF)-like protein